MAVEVLLLPKYSIVRSEDYVLTEEDAKSCVAAIRKEIDNHTRRFLFIFDFENVLSVSGAVWRILSTAAKEIIHNESRIAVLANHNFEKLIAENGLDHILPCYRSLDDVVEPAPPLTEVNSQVLELLNAMLDGTCCTMKTLAGITPIPGNHLPRGAHPDAHIEIAGSVGLLSKPFRGSLTLAFPVETYTALTSRLMGQGIGTPDAPGGGLVGELLSMIVGHGKLNLHAKHYAIRRTSPVIVQGSELKVFHSEGGAAIIIPFVTELGPFYLELAGIPADHKHR